MMSSKLIGNKRASAASDRLAHCSSSNNNRIKSDEMTNPPRKRHSAAPKRASCCLLVVVPVVAILLLTCNRQYLTSCQAAVIRPTVFSDLNTSQDNNAVQQQQATPASPQAIQQQQQQQQQQHQQTQQQQSQQSNLNTLSAAAAASPLADAAAQQQHSSTKISPLKSRFCYASNQQQRIDQPLGLQSFAIDELAISASSSSNEQVKPNLARLNLDIRGGAWCPANPVHAGNFGKEWLQVKLNRSHVITAIETQGRWGMGNGKEFVSSYQVEYSRNGGRSWHKWKDIRGSQLLRANDDPNNAVKNELSPPIVGANVIRILPYSSVPRTVCMRLELHGCLFDEGAPIAYSSQDGVVDPRWGHLIDYTYDGLRMPSGELSHGLGQLVDGVKGPDNFSYNNGFEWVGWKSTNGDVVIEFTFRTLRNFTGALFHSNNLFSNGVEVFQAVDVHYGIDVPQSMEALKDSLHEQQRRSKNHQAATTTGSGGHEQPAMLKHTLWSQDVLSIEYEPDKKSESSRPVTVHLKQRLANKLKFVLKFASKWILVSEVEFLSHPVELLALSSLSQTHSPQLMAHLQPAKSYDEYVAILREHQLRRLAAETLIFHSTSSSASASSAVAISSTELPSYPSAPTAESNDQPSAEIQTTATDPTSDQYNNQMILLQQQQQQQQAKRLGAQWPPSILIDSSMPATNPLLSNSFAPSLYPAPPLPPSQVEPEFKSQQKAASSSSPIGLTTVISFVLVLVILLVGLLFVVSSYRMRCHQSTSKLGRHLAGGPGGPVGLGNGNSKQSAGNGGLMGPSLHNFMSVFSSPASNGHHSAVGAHQASDPEHHLYNAIFDSHTTHRRPSHHHIQPTSALRRLATLGSSSNKGAHPLLMGGQSPSSGNQLLVSVKDASSSSSGSSGNGLFGSATMAPKHQGINTQLIIGLNQPPQNSTMNNIYNNNNNQHTYATHYSTSMSMASSSTNGGQQGDYGDYAIPDAVPIIPPNHPQQQPHHYQHQMHQLIQQHQQQPFVSRLTQNGQQVRSTLVNQQQQQQQQQQHPIQQHNYEPV